jgi:hypothetical protein
MEIQIQIQMMIKGENGDTKRIESLGQFKRDELSLQTLGLTLEESKSILENIQGIMVAEQAEAHLQKNRCCAQCSAFRSIKGRSS